MGDEHLTDVKEKVISEAPERTSSEAQYLEKTVTEGNLVYDDVEEEPELHMRTYIALASMFLLNLVQVFALQGPPVVVRSFTSFDLALQTELALLYWDEPRQLSGLARPGFRTRYRWYRLSSLRSSRLHPTYIKLVSFFLWAPQ